jgi:hypothetical protein
VGLALLLLVAANFVRGVPVFGVNAAGNDSRSAVYLFAPATGLFAMRHSLRLDSARLCRWIIILGIAYASIALLRWAGVLEMPIELEEDLRVVTRVLPANEAFIVAQALIASVFFLIARGLEWWSASLAFILAAVTLFLQHRSVWAAACAGLLGLYLRAARKKPKFIGLGLVGVAVLALIIAAPVAIRSVREVMATNIGELEGRNSTWTWRVAGYIEAIDRTISSSPLQLSVGPPSGEEFEGSGVAAVHIHSRFVAHFAYYGIVGTLFLVLWFLTIGQQMRESKIRDHNRRDAGLICLQSLFISELVYFLPYQGGFPQGLMLGVIWAACPMVTASPESLRELMPASAGRSQ